jgi:hypothetical protein
LYDVFLLVRTTVGVGISLFVVGKEYDFSLILRPSFDSYLSCRPGQEAGNIPFVENAGFGRYSDNPIEIATIVSEWLSSPPLLESMQLAAIKASRPQATLDIAKDIANILFTKKRNDNNEKLQQASTDQLKTERIFLNV